jgi:hypothetical protein
MFGFVIPTEAGIHFAVPDDRANQNRFLIAAAPRPE